MSGSEVNPLDLFIPTRAFAIERLAAFVPSMGEVYARRRNFDLGPNDRSNVSLLSPHLRIRLVNEIDVARAALSQFPLPEAEKFIQEVFWRTYWLGYLEHHPSIWEDYLNETHRLVSEYSENTTYQSAINGETGIEVFDTWISELTHIGYLHNHARMWFASIWIFTLKLPWQLGAHLFLRNLLDGDPASNTLSWRWVAGLHTKGKAYFATADNIRKYTEGRFPEAQLGQAAAAIAEDKTHPTIELPDLPSRRTAPSEHAELFLFEEDLDTFETDLDAFEKVTILFPTLVYERYGISEKVIRFRELAARNRQMKLQTKGKTEVNFIRLTEKAYDQYEFCNKGIDTVVLRKPKQGFWTQLWPEMVKHLEGQNVDVREHRTWWENELFPHCTAGFFKMKKRLPDLLQKLAVQHPA